MIALGAYEKWALEALRRISAGPWRTVDVERLAVEHVCAVLDGPAAQRWREVRDWLTSLSHIDRVELVERLNENRNRG